MSQLDERDKCVPTVQLCEALWTGELFCFLFTSKHCTGSFNLIYLLLHEFNKGGYIVLNMLDRGIFTLIKYCLSTISFDLSESDIFLHKKYT